MTGKELRDLRERKGISRSAAARMVGSIPSTAFKWERADLVKAQKAYDLRDLLNEMPDVKRVRPIITHPPHGEEITILRKAYGFSQEALADMVGVGQNEMSRYEHGKEVPPDIEDSFCELFGIRIPKED